MYQSKHPQTYTQDQSCESILLMQHKLSKSRQVWVQSRLGFSIITDIFLHVIVSVDAILQRLPLSPQDFHVIGLASELAGWNESFLDRPSAKSGGAKAKAKANGDQGQGQTDIGLALWAAATSTFWCCGSCAASNACGGEGPPLSTQRQLHRSYACGSSSPIGSLQSHWRQHPSCGWMSFWLLPDKGRSLASGGNQMRSFARFVSIPIDPANWRENLSLPCGHYHERLSPWDDWKQWGKTVWRWVSCWTLQ